MQYNKSHKSPEEILHILRNRNLIIDDKEHATHHLTYTGYFRLSLYGKVFQKNNSFDPKTTFKQIVDLYNFDRELRLLFIDALERIEVGFRTALNLEMSNKYTSDWIVQKQHYTKPYIINKNTDGKTKFDQLCKIIKNKVCRSNDIFIKEYRTQYTSPEIPPSWMLLEIMDFGNWSVVFSNLLPERQKLIKKHFDLQPEVMVSWIRSLSYLRNLCAHHSNVWNRNLTIKPLILNKKPPFNDNTKIYCLTITISHFLDIIEPENNWKQRLYDLLADYPAVSITDMGFPENHA